MSEPTIPDDDRQRRLEEAMAEYLIAADAGRPPEAEAFLARYPDLRAELVEFLADLSALAGLVEPLLPAWLRCRSPGLRPSRWRLCRLALGRRRAGQRRPTLRRSTGLQAVRATVGIDSATGTETTADPTATATFGEGPHGADAGRPAGRHPRALLRRLRADPASWAAAAWGSSTRPGRSASTGRSPSR